MNQLENRIKTLEKQLLVDENDYQITIFGWQESDFKAYDYPPTPEEIARCKTSGCNTILRFAEGTFPAEQ